MCVCVCRDIAVLLRGLTLAVRGRAFLVAVVVLLRQAPAAGAAERGRNTAGGRDEGIAEASCLE